MLSTWSLLKNVEWQTSNAASELVEISRRTIAFSQQLSSADLGWAGCPPLGTLENKVATISLPVSVTVNKTEMQRTQGLQAL